MYLEVDAVLLALGDDILSRHEWVQVDLRTDIRNAVWRCQSREVESEVKVKIWRRGMRTWLSEGRVTISGLEESLTRSTCSSMCLTPQLDTPMLLTCSVPPKRHLRQSRTRKQERERARGRGTYQTLLLSPLKRPPTLLPQLRTSNSRVHQVQIHITPRSVLDRVLDRLDRVLVRRRSSELGGVEDL